MQANRDIREAVRGAGLRFWQVADALGERDYVLSRRLRYELGRAEKQRVLAAVRRLRQERGEK